MTSLERTYRDLIRLPTFLERFEYLSIKARVGESTFGSERWMNQAFYTSKEWRSVRQFVIARDEGRDLGVEGYEIGSRPVIHHILPISAADIVDATRLLLDPNNLITTTHNTHNAIHFGDATLLPTAPVERQPGDTFSWTPITRETL